MAFMGSRRLLILPVLLLILTLLSIASVGTLLLDPSLPREEILSRQSCLEHHLQNNLRLTRRFGVPLQIRSIEGGNCTSSFGDGTRCEFKLSLRGVLGEGRVAVEGPAGGDRWCEKANVEELSGTVPTLDHYFTQSSYPLLGSEECHIDNAQLLDAPPKTLLATTDSSGPRILHRRASALLSEDPKAAVPLLERLSERGYLPSKVKLAYVLKVGVAVEKDDLRARRLFEEAAEQGSLEAMESLSWVGRDSVGEEDYLTLLKWDLTAVAHRDVEALNRVRLFFEVSDKVPRNRAEGERWRRRFLEVAPRIATRDSFNLMHDIARAYRDDPSSLSEAYLWERLADSTWNKTSGTTLGRRDEASKIEGVHTAAEERASRWIPAEEMSFPTFLKLFPINGPDARREAWCLHRRAWRNFAWETGSVAYEEFLKRYHGEIMKVLK